MSHQLITLLRGSIEGYRIVHTVVNAKWNLLVTTIHTRRGGINQMLHRIITTGLKDVIETNEVALDIGIGVRNRIAYASLCSQIDNHLRVIVLKKVVNGIFRGDVAFDKDIVDILRDKTFNLFQSPFLEADIIVVIHIVNANDSGTFNILKQALNKIRTDKACTTCDQNGLFV